MGQISDKLIKRLGRSRKLANGIRQVADAIQHALDALGRGESIPISRGEVFDPLHAVYVAVQNVTSIFAERVSVRSPSSSPITSWRPRPRTSTCRAVRR